MKEKSYLHLRKLIILVYNADWKFEMHVQYGNRVENGEKLYLRY